MTRTMPGLGASFLPARLGYVRRCPARADYVELHFTTAEGAWHWCFSRQEGGGGRPARPLVLQLDAYGVQAHPIEADGIGPAVLSSEALPMILAGAEVHIERRLVTAQR